MLQFFLVCIYSTVRDHTTEQAIHLIDMCTDRRLPSNYSPVGGKPGKPTCATMC